MYKSPCKICGHPQMAHLAHLRPVQYYRCDQHTLCPCIEYWPSDNLEYLEWCDERRTN